MRLRAETWVSTPRAEVFPFFADAANLQALTPPWLHFSILTPMPVVMQEGTRIAYRLRLRGLPLRWESEITRYVPPQHFVDEQRRGPYKRWVHTHRFLDERGGTRLVDEVEFDVVARRLVGRLVARDLRQIFSYRHATLLEIFGQPHPYPEPHITITIA